MRSPAGNAHTGLTRGQPPNAHAHEPSMTGPRRVTTVGHACLFTPHTQMAPHGDAQRWKEVEEFTSSTKSGNNNNFLK